MTEKTVAAGLVTVAVEGVTFTALRPSENMTSASLLVWLSSDLMRLWIAERTEDIATAKRLLREHHAEH